MSMIRFISRNLMRFVVIFALYSAFSSAETRAQFQSFATRTMASIGQSLPGANPDLAPRSANEQVATVVRVIDGDTLVVRVGKSSAQVRVRMIGVNAPESTTKVECYGKKASAFSKAAMLPKSKVLLTFDKEPRDKYGRTLAYVTTSRGLDMQRALLQAGFARTMSIKPNTARAAEFKVIEQAAKLAKFGLWGAC